jgi:quinol monooxygenase YgiN
MRLQISRRWFVLRLAAFSTTCIKSRTNRIVSFLLERWSSLEALAAHDVTPHMLEADAKNTGFRAGPVEVLELGVTLA